MTRKINETLTPPQILTSAGFMAQRRLWEVFLFTLYDVYPIHWHEFHEVHFIVSGEGINLLNGIKYPIRQGSLFLMTPADFHELRPKGSTGLRVYNVIFQEEFLRDDLRDLVLATTTHMHGATEGPLYQQLLQEFEQIRQEASEVEPGYETMVHSGIERILTRLYRICRAEHGGAEPPRPDHPVPIQRALAHMHRYFRDPLTLADMGRLAGLSPNYFSEVFHEVTGESFQVYLQKLRLRFAKSLISTSELPVTEICYASGFNTLSHFERAFRSRYGCSPRAYRLQGSEDQHESL
jgi:AraC-like DNA-binding protein/mannose-6-phosphate isomerase-like protein (cupin superfamily)